MLDKIQVYVKMTVDVMVGEEEDRQEHFLLFWVRWAGTEDERRDAIWRACRECRSRGWAPHLSEHWEVGRATTCGHYICKSNESKAIFEIDCSKLL